MNKPDLTEWRRGVSDAIAVVEQRLAVMPDLMHPVWKACLEEQLIFLRAMLERGQRKDPIPVDSFDTHGEQS